MNNFKDLYQNEDTYWWAVVHRRVVISLLKSKMKGVTNPRILDIGCGGGRLLSELNILGQAIGMDVNFEAMEHCRVRDLNNVVCSEALRLPLLSESLDIICAVEVIEHIEDEKALLGEFSRTMKSGAKLLITAPAFNFLFSKHDEWVGHKRRYTISKLKKELFPLGFKVIQASYFHMILFPVLLIMAKWGRFSQSATKKQTVVKLPGFLNRFLIWLLSIEIPLLKAAIRLPFGSSMFIIAEKIK